MKKKIYIVLLCMMMILSLVGCSKSQKSNDANSNTNILDTSYDEILKSAKGTTVNFYGYGGNEVMNKWFDTYVIPQMKEKYDIKILAVDHDVEDNNKKLVIEVTDKKLIDLTGGIIQGMSGSPIIQDGKIIGAVTHVFVNDPTEGYGILIEDMMK